VFLADDQSSVTDSDYVPDSYSGSDSDSDTVSFSICKLLDHLDSGM